MDFQAPILSENSSENPSENRFENSAQIFRFFRLIGECNDPVSDL